MSSGNLICQKCGYEAGITDHNAALFVGWKQCEGGYRCDKCADTLVTIDRERYQNVIKVLAAAERFEGCRSSQYEAELFRCVQELRAERKKILGK